MPALPSPASWLNTPQAMPHRAARCQAPGRTAPARISAKAPGSCALPRSRAAHAAARYTSPITGTSAPHTAPTRLAPPASTARLRAASASPAHSGGSPQRRRAISARALAWVRQPMPKAAQRAKAAHSTASTRPRRPPTPICSTFIGPPPPWAVRQREASVHSANFVAMPAAALSHIQARAPGPPSTMALATPTMVPVPTVAARLVISA